VRTPPARRRYYNAIDPTSSKRDFKQWLKNAGFIVDVSQWHPSGTQLIACNQPGCDLPAGTYGDNVINTDSHAMRAETRRTWVLCATNSFAASPVARRLTQPSNHLSGELTRSTPLRPPEMVVPVPIQERVTRLRLRLRRRLTPAVTRPLGALPGCDPSKTGHRLWVQDLAHCRRRF